jgi:hypothetical protein
MRIIGCLLFAFGYWQKKSLGILSLCQEQIAKSQ